MAITQKFLNLDVYYRTTTGDKIIVNDLDPNMIKEDKEKMNLFLKTVYDSDVLSTKPSCDCGKTTGRYRIGKKCKHCSAECLEPHDKVKPILWLRAYREDLPFVNPAFWSMLRKEISGGNKNIDSLRYLTDQKYNPLDISQELISIRDNVLGGIRSYAHTIRHIPNILVYCINLPKNRKDDDKRERLEHILKIYNEHKQDLFSTYMPIINKRLFVVEKTSKGTFVSTITSDIVNVIMDWTTLCNEGSVSENKLSHIMGDISSSLSKLFDNYMDAYVIRKKGLFRKHVFGARSHFTFRNVIISRAGRHNYDGVEVPWFVGITAFRPHIVNKLFKRGYSYKEINTIIYRAVKQYNPIIDEILHELIQEAPEGKIRILTQRNPSLKQGSSQYVYIDKFNTDPDNMCLKISPLICKAPNADFDGDELNQTILLDNKMGREFRSLRSFFYVPDIAKPCAVSGYLGLLSPATSILSNYLYKNTGIKKENIVPLDKFKFKTVDVKTK